MTVSAEAIQPNNQITAQPGAAGYDWVTIWRAMYDAEHVQTSALVKHSPTQPTDRWAGRARSFAQATGRASQPDAFMRTLLPHLRPSDTLLDVGAGAGRHTIWLARQVAQVLAVEPSAAMREQLAQRSANLPNISVFAEAWPTTSVPQCDIAICAHVIYGVRDIAPFLSRMNQIARRACFILVGFRQPSFVLRPFWETIYGETRLPLPGALECLNVLYQLGIAAQLTLLPASRYVFADRQDAFDDLRWRLALPDTPESAARLGIAIDTLLQPEPTGGLSIPEQPNSVALIWWADHS